MWGHVDIMAEFPLGLYLQECLQSTRAKSFPGAGPDQQFSGKTDTERVFLSEGESRANAWRKAHTIFKAKSSLVDRRGGCRSKRKLMGVSEGAQRGAVLGPDAQRSRQEAPNLPPSLEVSFPLAHPGPEYFLPASLREKAGI